MYFHLVSTARMNGPITVRQTQSTIWTNTNTKLKLKYLLKNSTTTQCNTTSTTTAYRKKTKDNRQDYKIPFFFISKLIPFFVFFRFFPFIAFRILKEALEWSKVFFLLLLLLGNESFLLLLLESAFSTSANQLLRVS